MNTTIQNTPKYKNSPLGMIPEDWEVKTLASISNRIGDGLHGTPKYVNESDYFFVNGNNLKNNIIEIDKNTKCVSYEEYLKHKKDLSSNCLLLSINGTIGNLSFYNNEKIVLGKSAAYINCKPENINYIFYYLQSSKVNSFFDNELTGSTIRNLSLKSIREIPILLPPTEEQNAITDCLSTWDQAIEKQTALIAQKELAKKALMQQLLSGKKRLKGFSGEWKELRLKDLGVIVSGLTYSPEDVKTSGVLVLRSSNIQEKQLDFRDCVYVEKKESEFNPVKKGDILICVRNGSRSLIGKNVMITQELEGVAFGAFMTVFRSDVNNYLIHLFDTDYYFSEVNKNLGATINSINGSDLKLFKFPIPPLEEQTAIANILQCADEELKLLKRKLAQLKEQKKGLMQVLLTGKKRLKY